MGVRLIVQHHVKDYEQWKPIFDEHEKVRRQHGGTGHRLNRSLDDRNTLVIAIEFETAEGARAFAADPSLKEAMDRAGVDSAPNIYLCEQVEQITY